ncbi:MAG: energy transducer TonB [Flavobacteriales bacterium]|nr:energy transducer TonB [Flavobacteriales bacterium]
MKKFNQKRENKFPFMHRFLTGMIIALSLTLTAFEWTTIKTTFSNPDSEIELDDDDTFLPPITYRKVKRPIPKKTNTAEMDIVKELTPEVEPEKEIEKEMSPEKIPSNEDLRQLSNVNPEEYGGEEVFNEDDIFTHINIEIFAHYDDCADLVGEELMECSILELSNRIKSEFIISNQLKNIGGRQAANMFFIIDKEGNIHSIKALASSSKAIEKDAIKAIKRLPRLNPAMQQGRAVSLQLTIPIQVHIQN